MKKIKKFKIKTYSNKTGTLTPLTFDKQFQMKVKRVFFINGKKNKIRGNHAHKKCYQCFFPVIGKFILNIETPKKKERIMLSHSSKIAVLVPPKHWCSVKFISKISILMVACNQYFKANDYLRNFDEYKKYMRKK